MLTRPAARHQNGNRRPAGYAALAGRYGLDVIPNWHTSHVLTRGTRRRAAAGDSVAEEYPATYWPGDGFGDQLEFALKYDGTNLAILARLFEEIAESEMLAYVRARPTGKYVRRAWFLYELITGNRLPIDDLPARGSYVDLLEPDACYTTSPSRRVRRQRVNDNLLGNSDFCPTVRRTDTLRQQEDANLSQRCLEVVSGYPTPFLKRALGYLYEKETKSSFAIEHAEIDSTRTERFVALLRSAEAEDFCRRDALVGLQNRIVDPRFRDTDYRQHQSYVGQSMDLHREIIQFVGAKPESLASLMAGLIAAHERMESGGVHAAIHAAVIAYGFVFLHPFEDGNGRIHRFLIHNILARRGFTPPGLIFPVSAAMLNRPQDYDDSLEAFSRQLMPLVDYELDGEGRLTVRNETAPWYRFIDFTAQTQALFQFLSHTIDSELAPELAFLAKFDRAKAAIQDIVDMPDRKIELFVRLCRQNGGRLSRAKRASQFAMLSDAEVAAMEGALGSAWSD
ncbi:MAG: cell filamentation protein Fic [Gammaproteobacteria bacterium]|nr:cell filamentation protein Fic [Gammaproteobacteria bacterium]